MRSLHHVSNLLGNVIDFEESAQEQHIVIRTGVSSVLDVARTRYEDLDNVRFACTRMEIDGD